MTGAFRAPLIGTVRGCLDARVLFGSHRIVRTGDIRLEVREGAPLMGSLPMREAAEAAAAVFNAWDAGITPARQRAPVTFTPYPLVRPRVETPDGPAWHFQIRRDSTAPLWLFAMVWDDVRVCLKDTNGETDTFSPYGCLHDARP